MTNMDPLITADRDFLMDEKIRLERENAKLRAELAAARQALDPGGELTSLSVAEIAALKSMTQSLPNKPREYYRL